MVVVSFVREFSFFRDFNILFANSVVIWLSIFLISVGDLYCFMEIYFGKCICFDLGDGLNIKN